MVRVVKLLNQVRKDEDGTALLEYSILIGIVAVAAIAYITGIGNWAKLQFSTMCASLAGATC